MHKSIMLIGERGQVAQSLRRRAEQSGVPIRFAGRDLVDVTDAASVDAYISAVEPGQMVVNATAYTAVDKAEDDSELAFAVNATAPAVIAKACSRHGARFLHISTDYVFDGTKTDAYVEDDPTAPLGVYGRSKLDGETGVLDALSSSIILRTAWVYSPFGSNFVRTMLRLGAERDEVRVVDDQIGSPTSADTIADAILAVNASEDYSGGVYHFVGTGSTSWAGFADHIFDIQNSYRGRRPVLSRIRTSEYPTPAKRPSNSVLDCTKFEAMFDYRAPPWTKSLNAVLHELLTT